MSSSTLCRTLLPGITRDSLITLARELGHTVTERLFSVDEWRKGVADGTVTVEGELTIKGITKPVTLELELNGFGPDAYGGFRAGFSAKTEISRKAFGVDIDMPMDGGGVVVGDKINVELEIEAVLRTA